MKKRIYTKTKIILIFLVICSSFLLYFLSYYSLAEFKFKDLQKEAADIDGDGNISNSDMEILVNQDFPQRPEDGVKNESGEGYLVDLFAQSTYRHSSGIASGDVIKVLMIGNSYSYYSNAGGILAEIAHKAGYRIIVVNAVHNEYYGKDFYNKHDLWTYCWDYSGDKLQTIKHDKKGSRSLQQIAQANYGKDNTAGKWDYIFLQDQEIQKGKANFEADKKTLNLFLSNKMIDSVERFVINASVGPHRKPRGRNKVGGACTKFAKQTGAGIIYSAEVINKSSVSTSNLQLRDKPRHPTPKSQYINALCMYAKIFGIDKLPNTKGSSNFIEVYNSNGGKYTEFVTEANPQLKKRGFLKGTKVSVDKQDAINFQNLVYRCYDKYIK